MFRLAKRKGKNPPGGFYIIIIFRSGFHSGGKISCPSRGTHPLAPPRPEHICLRQKPDLSRRLNTAVFLWKTDRSARAGDASFLLEFCFRIEILPIAVRESNIIGFVGQIFPITTVLSLIILIYDHRKEPCSRKNLLRQNCSHLTAN